jgi:AraC family transcriptional regulator of adaptative response/methylated-DNA-[protein]-cysteine methyltransferase
MRSTIEISNSKEAPHQHLHAGQSDTPVGKALLAWDDHGIRELAFGCDFSLFKANNHDQAVVRDDQCARRLLESAFSGGVVMPLVLCGTPFQHQVWRELMSLPCGLTISYGDLAKRINLPKGARAVGRAVGSNRIGFLVPCHRVVRADGVIGQFRWGMPLKQRLLSWEAGQIGTGTSI